MKYMEMDRCQGGTEKHQFLNLVKKEGEDGQNIFDNHVDFKFLGTLTSYQFANHPFKNMQNLGYQNNQFNSTIENDIYENNKFGFTLENDIYENNKFGFTLENNIYENNKFGFTQENNIYENNKFSSDQEKGNNYELLQNEYQYVVQKPTINYEIPKTKEKIETEIENRNVFDNNCIKEYIDLCLIDKKKKKKEDLDLDEKHMEQLQNCLNIENNISSNKSIIKIKDKENTKKVLKSRIITASLDLLNFLIVQISPNFKKFNKRDYKIHKPQKALSQRVSKKDDSFIEKKTFEEILIHQGKEENGRLQFKNRISIEYVKEQIKIFYEDKNNIKQYPEIDNKIKTIQNLLNTKFLDLIDIYVMTVTSKNNYDKKNNRLDFWNKFGIDIFFKEVIKEFFEEKKKEKK